MTSAQRMKVPALASLPTLAESGLPGFNFSVWHGLYAPRGTPPAVIEKLNAALRTALKDPELIKRQEALGLTVVTDGRLAPAEHKKFFESESQSLDEDHQGRRHPARVISIESAARGANASHAARSPGAQNGKTRLAFHQAVFDSIESRDGHEEGWSSAFELLAEFLAHVPS